MLFISEHKVDTDAKVETLRLSVSFNPCITRSMFDQFVELDSWIVLEKSTKQDYKARRQILEIVQGGFIVKPPYSSPGSLPWGADRTSNTVIGLEVRGSNVTPHYCNRQSFFPWLILTILCGIYKAFWRWLINLYVSRVTYEKSRCTVIDTLGAL